MVVADGRGEVLRQVPPGCHILAQRRVVEAQHRCLDLAQRHLLGQGVNDPAEVPVKMLVDED